MTISILCKKHQREALARLGGEFWESSGSALDEVSEGEAGDEEEEAWWVEVEQGLQTITMAQVQGGLGADDLFHIPQLHIILD